ncbi:MAG TPA: sugar phosphate isomerase/epimerase [Gemmatimonadaceae bacterium]
MKQLASLSVAGLVLALAVQGCGSQTAGRAESATTAAAAVDPHEIRYSGDFRAPLGVQLWTFRELAKTDPVAMMHTVRRLGFTHVETAGLYDMPVEKFAQALKDAGLQATSMHVGYEDLRDHPETVIANAKALGAKWVGLAWYPHEGAFTEADARKAIADFNRFGRTMKDAGLSFFYHDHGYEPVPYGDGTLLDLIIRETDPQLVHFEMDVLWTYLPGVDPVALIKKYPGRFRLMHIKDMKPGVARGSLAGGLPDSLEAPIGEGQVPWPALMQAAQQDGFEEYYIEDETPAPLANVPKSIAYLEKLRY